MKITGTKKKFIPIVFLIFILNLIYIIWLGVFLNIHLLVVIIGLFPISIIEGVFILYYYSKSIRKIDVSIYQGKGTKNDPIIINSISSISSYPILFRMKNLNIVLKNLELDDLGIFYSKNIIIENCYFKDIHIYKSEEIEVKDSSISKSLSVSNCIKVSIDSSEIWQLELNRNLFSIYQNNHIDNIVHISKEKPNSNNVYRNNIINQDVPLN
ncbi:MAG: hypothetical protein MUP85_22400 [Candidatus Lokiarchaeota archaeon]|nr:hypothetical protein [Candidatus Lokiarchaeota archaeon]